MTQLVRTLRLMTSAAAFVLLFATGRAAAQEPEPEPVCHIVCAICVCDWSKGICECDNCEIRCRAET